MAGLLLKCWVLQSRTGPSSGCFVSIQRARRPGPLKLGAYDGGSVTAIDMAGIVVGGARRPGPGPSAIDGGSLTLEAVTTLDVSVGSTVSSVAVVDDGKTP